MNRLIGFGYWHSLHASTLPDPAWFVDASWSVAERQRVVRYLQAGHVLRSWMGFSWCRFRCNIPLGAMGADDLTDGIYCWPEGLAHYILAHNLRLPDQIIRHILNQPVFPVERARQVPETSEVDLTWWCTQKGWYSMATSFLSESEQEMTEFMRRYNQGKLSFEYYTEEGLRAVIQLINKLKNHPMP